MLRYFLLLAICALIALAEKVDVQNQTANVTCPPPPPIAAPPADCNYNISYDKNGCPIAWNLVCNIQCMGENEEFTDLCDCELSCQTLGKRIMCPQICRRSCFCKSGYVRDAFRACVLESECPKNDGNKEICRLPAATGPCRAEMPRFHYNSVRQQCEQFIYGGCGGNENRFNSPNECEMSCGGVSQCPNGIAVVQCLLDPCQNAKCPSNRSANCITNYCGSCNVRFYDMDGREVTSQCHNETMPVPGSI